MPPSLTVQGQTVPGFVYGTAWKEDATEACVRQALAAGFTGIDTANQRKHYFEAGVGAAVAEVPRERLWLQSKFTYPRGQDHRLPYDADAPLATQVRQSFESSCEHLGTERLDSYLLHGPAVRGEWSDADRTVWRELEALHSEGRVGLIGVSNVGTVQLRTLLREAKIPPAFVQHRCKAEFGWGRKVRRLCNKHGVVYQGFSLLTANRRFLGKPAILGPVRRLGVTPAQVVFRFAHALGMLPLTGSTDARHLAQDLVAWELPLTDAEVDAIERVGG